MKLRKFNSNGFTLIEVMIVVAIIGILATISYPSYTQYVTQSNRTEGQRELLRIANLMEQRFLDMRAYTNDLRNLGFSNATYTTESGLYVISSVSDGTTFTLTADAQGHQASADSACDPMTVNDLGQRTPIDDCWE